LAFVGNTLFTGSHLGEIHPWNGPSKGKEIKAHTGKVSTLYADKQSLISGGEDGKIIQWAVTGATL